MDIDKILFGQLSQTKGINNPFEDLDVDKNGVINEEDANCATSDDIKSAINNLLQSEDTEEVTLADDAEFDENENVSSSDNVIAEDVSTSNMDNGALIKEYEQYKNEKEALQEKYDNEQTKLEEAQKLLDTYTKEYDNYQKEIEEVNNQILSEQKRQEVNQEEQMDSLINKAVNSYNKEEDGDFDSYLQKTMDNNGYPIYSNLDVLSTNSTLLSDKAKYVLNNIKMQSSIVAGLQTSLNSISSELNNITEKINDVVSKITTTTTVDNVTEVKNLTVSEITETDIVPNTTTTATATKTEIKTQEEYNEILNSKYDELWEKFGGDTDKIQQYVKDNLGSFMDIDGDGEVTLIDNSILNNYYNSLPKSGSTEWKENGRDYSFTKQKVFYSIESKTHVYCITNDTHSYSLKDFEKIINLTSGNIAANTSSNQYVKNAFLRNLNISSVVTEDNWEEKFKEIKSKLGINSSTSSLEKQLTTASEYAKNNPETKGYAGLASAFSNYSSATKHATQLQERENNILAAHPNEQLLYGAGIDNKYDWYMSKYYTQNANFTDINGDGSIDASDLTLFRTDIDLDGDGTVSNEERTFLNGIKKALEKKVYNSTVENGYNNANSIDDVITYLDNFNSTSYINNYVETNTQHLNDVISGLKNADTSARERYNYAVLRYAGAAQIVFNGYLDGTGAILSSKNIMESELVNATPDEMAAYMKQLAKASSPQNTYLHYIQSADLSKCELEEILSKINNASAAVQSQLAEVKTVVEEKLKTFSK